MTAKQWRRWGNNEMKGERKMKKRIVENAVELGNGQRARAAAHDGGPPDDDHSPAAESFRAWVRLGKPKGEITKEPPEQRGTGKRPKYDAAKAKLDKLTMDDAETELKRKRLALKKYPKKRSNTTGK